MPNIICAECGTTLLRNVDARCVRIEGAWVAPTCLKPFCSENCETAWRNRKLEPSPMPPEPAEETAPSEPQEDDSLDVSPRLSLDAIRKAGPLDIEHAERSRHVRTQ